MKDSFEKKMTGFQMPKLGVSDEELRKKIISNSIRAVCDLADCGIPCKDCIGNKGSNEEEKYNALVLYFARKKIESKEKK